MKDDLSAYKAISKNFKIIDDVKQIIIHQDTMKQYNYNCIDTKILVYEDRINGWFLDYGEKLKKYHDAGFVVLQIALAQIEGLEQYYSGESSKGGSCKFFIESMKRIFEINDIEDSCLEKMYDLTRCGLFHDGMTRNNVLIENNADEAIIFKNEKIRISPNKFFDKVNEFIKSYIKKLKDSNNKEERKNFEKSFDRYRKN